MPHALSERRALRDELKALFAKAKMPTSPALAAHILQLSEDPTSNSADFAEAIRNDAALSGRLLKTANSVRFAQRVPVTTVERAVTVLGIRRVKTLSLGFQLVRHLDQLGGAPFDMKTFWQHSLLRACLAQSTAAEVIRSREEEAFLIGLLEDCGIPLLVQILGCGYTHLCSASHLSPTAAHTVEKASFPCTHVDAISVMAAEWELPDLIAVPLETHHQRTELSEEPSELQLLQAVAYFAGSLGFAADVTITPEERSLEDFCATALGFDDQALSAIEKAAHDEYNRISKLYSDVLPDDIDVTDLLNEATRRLASAADDADASILDEPAERNAIYQENARLAGALRDYRERAALDPLTGLANRGALTESARRAIQRNLNDGTPVGVLFIDLDDFKRLNDTCGHRSGDNALREVAALLLREAGSESTVGRYGGEEFVVVTENISADATRAMAERILVRVRALENNKLGFSGQLTCSIGGLWSEALSVRSAEHLFATADELMYRAKRLGKDRCCFEAPQEAVDVHVDAADKAGMRRTRPHAEPSADDDPEARLGNLLGIAARLNESGSDEFKVRNRKQARHALVAPCRLSVFTGTGTRVATEDAATRNISTGGVAVVVARPATRGEAVEVVLDRGDSKFFLAGLVAFCRHLSGSVHEVGIQLVTHSVKPIITGENAEAFRTMGWVARAFEAKVDGKLDPQRASKQR